MGYTTEFDGKFTVMPTLGAEHRAYLEAFSKTRRMRRDAAETAGLPDPVREAAGLPVGEEGGYFVGHPAPEARTGDVIDHNEPPAGQPTVHCNWTPLDDGAALGWNGNDSSYEYLAWLGYLIEHFMQAWGYRLDGEVEWRGEEADDHGVIIVEANRLWVAYRKSRSDDIQAPERQAVRLHYDPTVLKRRRQAMEQAQERRHELLARLRRGEEGSKG